MKLTWGDLFCPSIAVAVFVINAFMMEIARPRPKSNRLLLLVCCFAVTIGGIILCINRFGLHIGLLNGVRSVGLGNGILMLYAVRRGYIGGDENTADNTVNIDRAVEPADSGTVWPPPIYASVAHKPTERRYLERNAILIIAVAAGLLSAFMAYEFIQLQLAPKHWGSSSRPSNTAGPP